MPAAPRCNGLVVFTDLDGTLLDHETYDWSPAGPALAALRENGHGVVLASSKTTAEIAPLRSAVGFDHCPAIVENGAGILPPGAMPADDAGDHARIMAALDALPATLRAGFTGFSDWTDEQIAERTGLALPDARRAAERRHSEPGLWSGSQEDLDAFTQALRDKGVTAQRGGRFLTLSLGTTKAGRMMEIAAAIRQREPGTMTVALGDAPNDIEMLECADRGFIIRNDSHQGIPPLDGEKSGTIVRSAQSGPSAWNQCVLSLLSQFKGPGKGQDG